MRRARNLKGALLLVLLVLLINLPILNSRYLDWRVEHSGEDVLATVRDSRVISPQDNPEFFLEFEFPRDVDPDQESWNVQVDEASYEAALAAGELDVLGGLCAPIAAGTPRRRALRGVRGGLADRGRRDRAGSGRPVGPGAAG